MTVGATLAAARRQQGRSVEDLSAATKIRPHVIRALEADDLAACGGDVYARGHVRALARELGLDPEQLVAGLPGRPGTSASMRMPAADPSLVIRERRSAPRWTAAMAVALGIVACLAALRLVLPVDGGSQARDEPRAASSRTLAPPTSPSRAAKPSPRSSKPGSTTPGTKPGSGAEPGTGSNRAGSAQPSAQPSADPSASPGALAVALSVTGSQCWVTVRDSAGVTRLSTMLTEGQTAAFSDDQRLTVVVGDAGAVALSVNGRPVVLKGGTTRFGTKRFVIEADDPLAAFEKRSVRSAGSAG